MTRPPALIVVLLALLLAAGEARAADVSVGVLSRLAPRSLELRPAGHASMRLDGERTQVPAGEVVSVTAAGDELSLGRRRARSVVMEARRFSVRVGRDERWYEGELRLRSRAGRIQAVLAVPLESYVAGVVASEMPDAPPAALQAQAIAARSFALAVTARGRSPHEGYQLCDLTHCQSFRGVPGSGAAREAARATRGRVLLDGGDVVTGYYHSTCGGHTANPLDVFGVASPGLRGVSDLRPDGRAWCAASPHFRWAYAIPGASLRGALATDAETSPGATLTDVLVLDRSPQGRVVRVEVRGARVRRPSGETFWQVLGRALGWGTVESTWFEIKRTGSTYTFRGRGLGHGVGMCQYGAMEMARAGWNTRRILSHYYPDAKVGYAR